MSGGEAQHEASGGPGQRDCCGHDSSHHVTLSPTMHHTQPQSPTIYYRHHILPPPHTTATTHHTPHTTHHTPHATRHTPHALPLVAPYGSNGFGPQARRGLAAHSTPLP